MKNEELKVKSDKIIDKAIEQIGTVLNDVLNLDSNIKENQIREFKKQWRDVFWFDKDVNPDVELKFDDKDFKNQFGYLINRMKDNTIKESIIDISNKAILEIKGLWNCNNQK